mmetsp:Transcript_25392/g.63895  ORF Transcript_25392/g.63895 Transcript_25392/m.63895 type:complete len:114 (-) Transcript_25392:92-433(-)
MPWRTRRTDTRAREVTATEGARVQAVTALEGTALEATAETTGAREESRGAGVSAGGGGGQAREATVGEAVAEAVVAAEEHVPQASLTAQLDAFVSPCAWQQPQARWARVVVQR